MTWNSDARRRYLQRSPALPRRSMRRGIEVLEPRCLFAADPLRVGLSYLEADQGNDAHGDHFELTFRGGAEGSELTRVVIDLDKDGDGATRADLVFDTIAGGRGADAANNFALESLVAADPRASVTASVDDGGFQLILELRHFRAGDKLIFSIDVDEIQKLYSDPSEFNAGLDPIASGLEFEDVILRVTATAPHYEPASGEARFLNRFGDPKAEFGLDLPPDDLPGNESVRDRNAAATASLTQIPKPVSISGQVFVDSNLNLRRDAQDAGLANVRLSLFRQVEGIWQDTGFRATTNADGRYEFPTSLGLMPGVYQVREQQPEGYLSVGASTGEVSGIASGVVQSADVITNIVIPKGDLFAREYNFAEALPATISGYVYQDLNNDGVRNPGELPVVGSQIRIIPLDVIAPIEPLIAITDASGLYRFNQLPPGRYQLEQIEQPAGLLDGRESVGTVDGARSGSTADSGDRIDNIFLSSGASGIDYNFGELPPSELSGHVYYDANANGARDSEDGPLANAIVRLLDASGREIATTVTDSEGRYRFTGLTSGTYILEEVTPAGYLDGADQAGSIGGRFVGQAQANGDRIAGITLGFGQTGFDYNFGELLPNSIAGRVFLDSDGNCIFEAHERGLAGVQIELLDSTQRVLARVVTDENGRYAFNNLPAGNYTIRQIQPTGLFDGGAKAGTAGGNTSIPNQISGVIIRSGTESEDNDFCEVQPASISGYVFQDGPAILGNITSADPLGPAVRNGQRTPDDRPLAGVVLELRDAQGRPVDARSLLEGSYGPGAVRVVTDEAGFYQFVGLPPGTYHVYEIQPAGFRDGIDTPGSAGGFAVNTLQPSADPRIDALLKLLLGSPATNPTFDAILAIDLAPGQTSVENNFSELLVEQQPVPPILPTPQVLEDPVASLYIFPQDLAAVSVPLLANRKPMGLWDVYERRASWHLSIINAGQARLAQASQLEVVPFLAQQSAVPINTWSQINVSQGRWRLKGMTVDSFMLGHEDGIPVAGDFDGDGRDELGIFVDGQWFIDLNGNGKWDSEDLWIGLGSRGDQPVVGDWDGDGKSDIGIFGQEWESDPPRIARDPGLPDPANTNRDRPKNLPPNDLLAATAQRVMKRTEDGQLRADVIDHVFRFGAPSDQAIVGDWNGDGIDSLGVFRDGRWLLDIDGNGRWNSEDVLTEFGQAGDVSVVGDWNGDGIDDLGIVRGDEWWLDMDSDRMLTNQDQHLKFEVGEGQPVAGDWDGDGVDEPGVFSPVDVKLAEGGSDQPATR